MSKEVQDEWRNWQGTWTDMQKLTWIRGRRANTAVRLGVERYDLIRDIVVSGKKRADFGKGGQQQLSPQRHRD